MQANVIVDPRGNYLKTHLESIEITNIRPSHSLFLFCILLKLYTTKFQGKRSSLRCAPQKQENLAQEPGMKMLTVGPRVPVPGLLKSLGSPRMGYAIQPIYFVF